MSTTKIVSLDTSISTTYPPNHRGVPPYKVINILNYDRISTALMHTLSDLIFAFLIMIDEASVDTQTSPIQVFSDKEVSDDYQTTVIKTYRPFIYTYEQDGGSKSGFLDVLSQVEQSVIDAFRAEYAVRDDSEHIFDDYTRILRDIITLLSVQRPVLTRPKLIVNNHYNHELADQLTTLYVSQHKDQLVPKIQNYFKHIGANIFFIDPDTIYEYMKTQINPGLDAVIAMELESFWNAVIIAMTEEIVM